MKARASLLPILALSLAVAWPALVFAQAAPAVTSPPPTPTWRVAPSPPPAPPSAPPSKPAPAPEAVVVEPSTLTPPPAESVAPAPVGAPSALSSPDAISGPGATGPEPVLSAPRAVNKRRYNMALFGGALLLASYTADRLLMGDLSKSGVAWVPLVGPWFLLDLQQRQPVPNAATLVFLSLDGLLQAGGLTMTVLGLVLRERRLTVRLAAPTPATSPSPTPPSAP